MKVLIACEFSGVVRDAFRRLGHDATSCDLLDTEQPGPHIVGDAMQVAYQGDWDLMVAHPPCTYLANSGVRWLYERPGRWTEMVKAAVFFDGLLNAPIERVAVENPTMHRHAGIAGPDCAVHPWQFGDAESKRTCFWLNGLPPLVPEIANRPSAVAQSCWRAPPSADRWKDRSRFYEGMARAMAEQWGALL